MKRFMLAGLVLVVLVVTAWTVTVRPSNSRSWIVGQKVMPFATFSGDSVTIHDMRNFTYSNGAAVLQGYEDRAYDLNKLTTAWFILAPFSKENRGPAHTFLSFGFADSQYVAISVESRREVGEEYSIAKGLLRQYEIMYVVGDERDLIGLRAQRGDQVYLYPLRTTPEKARKLFVQMLERANSLREKPEFYNTLTNNCTTNILQHANRISPHRIRYGKEVLLPGYADELAERLGLIDSNLPIEQARQRFFINDRARRYANDPEFSTRIRASN